MKRILYFSADWCGPCKLLGPSLDGLRTEGIPIQKIDVDKNPDQSSKYSVRNIPSLILVDEFGNELKRLVGNQPVNAIKDWYNN